MRNVNTLSVDSMSRSMKFSTRHAHVCNAERVIVKQKYCVSENQQKGEKKGESAQARENGERACSSSNVTASTLPFFLFLTLE